VLRPERPADRYNPHPRATPTHPPTHPPTHQVKTAFSTSYYVDRPPVLSLLYVLDATLIRHTKRQQIAGVQVLELPPKSEEAVPGV
jgi:hypothetical protein